MHFSKSLALLVFLLPLGCQDQTSEDFDKLASENSLIDTDQVIYDSLFVPIAVAQHIALKLSAGGSFDKKARTESVNNKQIESTTTIKDRKARDAFYVFNYRNEKGFSIISADERMTPVLAYSEDGNIDLDSDNPGLAYWLSTLQYYVTEMRDGNLDAQVSLSTTSFGLDSAWANILQSYNSPCDPTKDCGDEEPPGGGGSGGGDPMPIYTWGPLIGTEWGQRCGYNDYTPWKNSPERCNRSPAGCGPVAVAQVLYYHRNQLGTMSYNGININFNVMDPDPNPNHPGNTPNIARLLRLIGDQIIIDYAKKYALADPNRIPPFFEFLGFSHSDKLSWQHSIVENEIKNNRPVILKARTSGILGISFKHHIWVVEGYRWNPNILSREYYMNWGWRWKDLGWYDINHWQGATSSNNYSYGRKMILARK